MTIFFVDDKYLIEVEMKENNNNIIYFSNYFFCICELRTTAKPPNSFCLLNKRLTIISW